PAGPSATATAELPLFGGNPTAPERPTRPMQAVETPPPSAGGRPSPGPAVPDGTPTVDAGWAATVGRLRGRKRLASVLSEVRPVSLEADTLTLEVRNGNAFVRDTLEDPETRRLIADAAAESFGRRLRIEYRFAAAPPPRLEAAGVRSAPTAPPRVREHPLVREALSLFGGTVVREVPA
ncbi:MAG: hypothetical protein HYV46_08550, partial [candidate division NC10 bacterium]|nr:hypothetical protein [candidate division NC10 bacterium]